MRKKDEMVVITEILFVQVRFVFEVRSSLCVRKDTVEIDILMILVLIGSRIRENSFRRDVETRRSE